MKYTAVYKNLFGNYSMAVDDYFSSKKDFKDELRANGFTCIRIFTDSEIEKIKRLPNTVPMTATEEYIWQH